MYPLLKAQLLKSFRQKKVAELLKMVSNPSLVYFSDDLEPLQKQPERC